MKTMQVTAASILLACSTGALAGAVQSVPVEILLNDDGSGSAIGNMTTARFSENVNELIGCGVRTFALAGVPAFEFAFCQAVDAAGGDPAFCSTENPALVHTVRSISDYSFITFAWDAAGECTNVGNSTQSIYIPESKAKAK